MTNEELGTKVGDAVKSIIDPIMQKIDLLKDDISSPAASEKPETEEEKQQKISSEAVKQFCHHANHPELDSTLGKELITK